MQRYFNLVENNCSSNQFDLVSQEKHFDLVWDINTAERLLALLVLLIVLATGRCSN